MSFGRYFGRLNDPPVYHASAVHLDGSTYLQINSLTSADNNDFSFVLWCKVPANTFGFGVFWQADPLGSSTSFADPEGAGGVTFNLRNSDRSKALQIQTNPGMLPTDTWSCIIASMNTTTGQAKCYLGDLDITLLVSNDTPFSIVNNGLSFMVGYDNSPGDQYIGDLADVRIMVGQSLLSNGDISVNTRRLFIDNQGKPVNPNVASAALGLPTMLFSGPAAQFGINQGVGGAFTTHGTLTNASTHP